MGTIQNRERETYETVWGGVPLYGAHAPGEGWAEAFCQMVSSSAAMARMTFSPSVLDAGCGSGKGALELRRRGFDVVMSDLTDEGLTDEARELPFLRRCLWDSDDEIPLFDYVYCCDVLEHVPTEFTMLVAARLLEKATCRVFMSIALVPDQFGAIVGRSLHQTVQPFTWWKERLAELGTIVEARDCIHTGLFLMRPR